MLLVIPYGMSILPIPHFQMEDYVPGIRGLRISISGTSMILPLARALVLGEAGQNLCLRRMTMRGVTITDRRDDNVLAVDLQDILGLLDTCPETTEWEISALECVGTTTDTLYSLAESKTRVPDPTLRQLAGTGATQIIEGIFTGYRTGQAEPWIIIRAVDSAAYDVLSKDDNVLAQVREHFKEVSDLPEDAW